jgi:hypothetical protein
MGEYGGKLLFFNFLVVLEKAPRVQFPLGPNCVSTIRGKDGSSADTISNKRMLEKDGNIVKFLCGCSELSWIGFNAPFLITHTMEMVKL